MTPVYLLLHDQPIAFWLAVGALLVAGGVAAGAPALHRAALAGLAAAVAAVALPGERTIQIGVFIAAAGALAAWSWRLHRRRPRPARFAPQPPAVSGDPRLLGRTVRAVAFSGARGTVGVDGAVLPARLAAEAAPPPPGALLRVVRVDAGELAVRPLQVD